MTLCHQCHRPVFNKRNEPFCTFYAWVFHLPCFLTYVNLHLKKKEWTDQEADVNDHQRTGEETL